MGRSRAHKAFTVRVYRVNGVIELPVSAPDAATARRQAVEEVIAGVRQRPGGPRLFFGEARCLVVAALDDDCETGGPWY